MIHSQKKGGIMLIFWSLIVVTIVGILPKKSWSALRIRWMLDYIGCRKRVVAWHRAQLRELDPKFRSQYDENNFLDAQKRAEAKGISDSDPRYPNRISESY